MKGELKAKVQSIKEERMLILLKQLDTCSLQESAVKMGCCNRTCRHSVTLSEQMRWGFISCSWTPWATLTSSPRALGWLAQVRDQKPGGTTDSLDKCLQQKHVPSWRQLALAVYKF